MVALADRSVCIRPVSFKSSASQMENLPVQAIIFMYHISMVSLSSFLLAVAFCSQLGVFERSSLARSTMAGRIVCRWTGHGWSQGMDMDRPRVLMDER